MNIAICYSLYVSKSIYYSLFVFYNYCVYEYFLVFSYVSAFCVPLKYFSVALWVSFMVPAYSHSRKFADY